MSSLSRHLQADTALDSRIKALQKFKETSEKREREQERTVEGLLNTISALEEARRAALSELSSAREGQEMALLTLKEAHLKEMTELASCLDPSAQQLHNQGALY